MSRKKNQPSGSPQRTKKSGAPRSNGGGAKTSAAGSTKGTGRARAAARHSVQWARWLWALVTTLLIAALLFETTMIYTIGVGVYMLSVPEFMGLWFIAGGYVLACIPPAFGLLIATGRFWLSLTHALWIGLMYGVAGFLFLDQIIAAL